MAEQDDVYEDDAALLAAITGASAPDTPELRAAREDIAVLRTHLALIARELDPPATVVQLAPQRNRRLRVALVGVAAAGALTLFGGGLALLGAHGNSSEDQGTSSAADEGARAGSRPDSAYLACAATVVTGTVTAVEGTEVTLKVTRAYKPTPGPTAVTFTTDTPLTRGTPVLAVFSPGSITPDGLFIGDQEIAAELPTLTRELQESGPCRP
ncbi:MULTISPECIES: hypothetical protein [unclassified Streptomyces]|uniref:hypothetical protein n=1 Tax=unclassified Streptomyces TaxID=2593676 RepID=UPI000DD7EDA0|nr:MULTISPECIES: hypothetical protein [unclassified Streptomyces]QZZ27838.1 hypothetical protein A7X85_17510 [Streptomyces sp. ST1015]